MTLLENETTTEVAIADIEAVATCLDALVGRLTYDSSFATSLANDPKQTLAAAGLELPKEPLEAYIRMQPERFERASEALFARVDSNFLMALTAPSCG